MTLGVRPTCARPCLRQREANAAPARSDLQRPEPESGTTPRICRWPTPEAANGLLRRSCTPTLLLPTRRQECRTRAFIVSSSPIASLPVPIQNNQKGPGQVPTSKRVAKKASRGLKNPKVSKAQKSIDASALAQGKPRAKAKPTAKRKVAKPAAKPKPTKPKAAKPKAKLKAQTAAKAKAKAKAKPTPKPRTQRAAKPKAKPNGKK